MNNISHISWSEREVGIYNEYNAKMSSIFAENDEKIENAVLQGSSQIVVTTNQFVRVYKRSGDSYCFYCWTATHR